MGSNLLPFYLARTTEAVATFLRPIDASPRLVAPNLEQDCRLFSRIRKAHSDECGSVATLFEVQLVAAVAY